MSLGDSAAAEQRARLTRLLIATGTRDRDAFRDLYTCTAPKLFGICLRICGDRPAAEDVLHDVYTIVWRKAGAFNPDLGSPITWLATIARNRSIDWRRGRRRYGDVLTEDAPDRPDPTPGAEAIMLADESTRRLRLCLNELDCRQRKAIKRAFFDGYTYAELAVLEGVPIGTMKSWIRRGLRRMRDRLEAI